MWQEIKSFKGYVFLFLLLCAVLGGLFGVVVTSDWHNVAITKFSPPMILSTPVFIVYSVFAYLMQGVAFGIVHARSEESDNSLAIFLFLTQFILGVLWLVIFFVFQAMGFATFDLFITVMVLMATYAKFRETSTIAAWLLLPYAVQIAFFALINGYLYVV